MTFDPNLCYDKVVLQSKTKIEKLKLCKATNGKTIYLNDLRGILNVNRQQMEMIFQNVNYRLTSIITIRITDRFLNRFQRQQKLIEIERSHQNLQIETARYRSACSGVRNPILHFPVTAR